MSLELGGKSPNIIFPDADLEKAIPNAMNGVFYNSGQVCVAGTRIFVQNEMYDNFLDQFAKATERMTIGDPLRSKDPAGTTGLKGAVRSRKRLSRHRPQGRRSGGGWRHSA